MSAFVVSLDFELRWGVWDSVGDDPTAYRRNLEGVRDVVPMLLELFATHEVGASWAVVGALACEGWDELHARAPRPPQYEAAALRRDLSRPRAWDAAGRVHFAPELVALVNRAPRQELASHTFLHTYFRERGVTDADVRADAAALARLFVERFGAAPTSLVFPRNQVARTDVLTECGIARWRENPRPRFWAASRSDEQSAWVRASRLADALLPIGARRAPAHEHRASQFVRFNLPRPMWRAHLRRMASDARRMRAGEAFHLWWHPHNLGALPDVGRSRVGELIAVLSSAAPDAPWQSMRETSA
jgi:hypothetical protein